MIENYIHLMTALCLAGAVTLQFGLLLLGNLWVWDKLNRRKHYRISKDHPYVQRK